MRKILLIVGTLLLLLLGAVWGYIFIFGAPESMDEIFAQFGANTRAPTVVENEINTTIDVGMKGEPSSERLRQLTTRPVVDAVFMSKMIRYVERGTGHIYDIDTETGEERLVSGTTIPRVIDGRVAPTGKLVTLTSEAGDRLVTILGALVSEEGEERLEITTLPEGAREVAFDATGDALNFFVPNTSGGRGYSYSLATKESSEIFFTPLRHVHVMWGDPTYVYTTPSARAIGYLFAMGSSNGEYVTPGAPGLMAVGYSGGLITTTLGKDGLTSQDVTYGTLPAVTLFPEKCTDNSAATGTLFCASPAQLEPAEYPDAWYKGVVSFTDTLFRILPSETSVQVLSNLEEESGRPIDVSRIGTNTTGTALYFINKYDDTLWMFEMSSL